MGSSNESVRADAGDGAGDDVALGVAYGVLDCACESALHVSSAPATIAAGVLALGFVRARHRREATRCRAEGRMIECYHCAGVRGTTH
jgi:hypothetical protein